MEKHYYKASHAHTEYEHLRSSSREGINLTEAEIVHIDDFVLLSIQKGQSIFAHVYAGHKDDIPFTSQRPCTTTSIMEFSLYETSTCQESEVQAPQKA